MLIISHTSKTLTRKIDSNYLKKKIRLCVLRVLQFLLFYFKICWRVYGLFWSCCVYFIFKLRILKKKINKIFVTYMHVIAICYCDMFLLPKLYVLYNLKTIYAHTRADKFEIRINQSIFVSALNLIETNKTIVIFLHS
jgi:hypothetical protein